MNKKKNDGKIMEKIMENKANIIALVCLLMFQWALYFAIVCPNENNLLPVKHILVLNSFEDAPNLKLISNAVSGYQTDSVEIVKDHFWGFNIEMQLLLLSIFALVFFVIFWLMDISPAPFLVPLFVILTISIFYHNYLGHRITDSFSLPSIESVVCKDDCNNSKDVGIVKCNQVKDDCKGIDNYIIKFPCDNFKIKNKKIVCGYTSLQEISFQETDKDKYLTEENGRKIVKIVKLDKRIMSNKVTEALALGIYVADPKEEHIKLNSTENPNEKESSVNKYKRASWDSKEHFLFLVIGLFCFLFAMIFVKHFSTVRNFDDSQFRFLILLAIIGGVLLVLVEKLIMEKVNGVTSLGEYAKLVSVILMLVGYERIDKNKLNSWFFIVVLGLGIIALIGLNDSGNMIILGVIVLLILFITSSWKVCGFAIFVIFVTSLAIVFGYQKYDQDIQWRLTDLKYMPESHSNIPWRIKDTWGVVKKPLYKCEIPVFWEKVKAEGEKLKPFYSTESKHKICYIKDKDNKGLDMVKNCTQSKDNTNELECELNEYFSNYSQVSYRYGENGEILGIEKNIYDKNNCSSDDASKDDAIKCRQINKDARLAIFAVLKDGFLGGGSKDKLFGRPAGFKENTFLLNNHYMYTDFVFCGLIAFFGLFLSGVVVFSLFALIWNCKIKPKHCGDNYKHFLYSNILVVILATQAIIHIGGNLNIIPFTGVILPFLSRSKVGTPVSFITLGLALGGLVSDKFAGYKLVKLVKWLYEKVWIWSGLKWCCGKYKKIEKWCGKVFHKFTTAKNNGK